MQFCCISDISSNFESRWHIVDDRRYIIAMFVLIIVNCLLTIILIFSLAFANMKVNPYKESILKWRPVIGLIFNSALIILVTRNSMFVLFYWSLPLFGGLCMMHMHLFLADTIPLVFNSREEWEKRVETERMTVKRR